MDQFNYLAVLISIILGLGTSLPNDTRDGIESISSPSPHAPREAD